MLALRRFDQGVLCDGEDQQVDPHHCSVGLITGYRTKHSQVGGTVLIGDLTDPLSMGEEVDEMHVIPCPTPV